MTTTDQWQPDLFGGQYRIRREPTSRQDNLEAARAEMRDTNSATLFEAIETDSED